MLNSVPVTLDREEAYKVLIEPKMRELWDMCQRYKVPMVSVFLTYSNVETGECHMRSSQIVEGVHSQQIPPALLLIFELLSNEELGDELLNILLLRQMAQDLRKVDASALVPGNDTKN